MDFACLSSAGHEKITSLMRNISFFLTKTIMEKQLCELLKQAFQNPEGSPERDRATDNLCIIVTQLKENQGKFPQDLEPYYPEALTQTQKDFRKDRTLNNFKKFLNQRNFSSDNINCQSPLHALKTRVFLTRWLWKVFICDCKDARIKNQKLQNKIGIEIKIPRLSEFSEFLEEEIKQIAIKLKAQIETDPDKRFRNCHVENKKDCNCQILVQLRYLKEPPLKLREISEQFEIPLPTISNYIDKKCKPLLQKIAKELGYE